MESTFGLVSQSYFVFLRWSVDRSTFFFVNVERSQLADKHVCMYIIFVAGFMQRHELQRNPPAVREECPN